MNDGPTTKPYAVTFEYHEKFIYVLVKGTQYDYGLIKSYFQDILRECEACDCKQILIEEDICDSAPLVDIYKISSELSEMGFAKIRIAFVDRHPDQKELNTFAQIIANSYGLDSRVFDNVTEAEEWLVNQERSS
jgi:hypothetical protein